MQRQDQPIMVTGIERIAAKARVDKVAKFTSIAHHINEDLLWMNLNKIPRNTTKGIDGMTVEETKETFKSWSKEMIDAVHRQGYKAPAVRRTYIPKPGKDALRPISIPNVSDRSLQKSVTDVLNAIYENDFLDSSFGGRPNVSAHHAIGTLHKILMTRKVNYIYEADLKNFFGTLDHGWVLKFIQHRVGDPRIISLIRRWLKAGVMEGGTVTTSEVGTVQGGPISVLLSNVYLHYVLDLWIEKIVKPRLKGEVYYVRYLDDFVLTFQYREDAEKFEKSLLSRLKRFSLEIEPSKTSLIKFGRFARSRNKNGQWEKLKTFYFLGFTFIGVFGSKFKVKMKTEKSRHQRSLHKIKELLRKIMHQPLDYQKRAINRLLSGLYRYYGIFGNSKLIRKLFHFTLIYWRRRLGRRSQNGKLNWVKYGKVLKHFPILKPKIYLNWTRLWELALL